MSGSERGWADKLSQAKNNTAESWPRAETLAKCRTEACSLTRKGHAERQGQHEDRNTRDKTG